MNNCRIRVLLALAVSIDLTASCFGASRFVSVVPADGGAKIPQPVGCGVSWMNGDSDPTPTGSFLYAVPNDSRTHTATITNESGKIHGHSVTWNAATSNVSWTYPLSLGDQVSVSFYVSLSNNGNCITTTTFKVQ